MASPSVPSKLLILLERVTGDGEEAPDDLARLGLLPRRLPSRPALTISVQTHLALEKAERS